MVYYNDMTAAKPFVKWAGGKSQLLDIIRTKYPDKIERYCDPFVGGGAVLFDVLSTHYPAEVLINDINADLINTYRAVRDNSGTLIARLAELQDEYRAAPPDARRGMYLERRDEYNALNVAQGVDAALRKAALFIFLNKTCFNGLYRVNSEGRFNVPFNNARNPAICDRENIVRCSEMLQGVRIEAGDYRECGGFIDGNTFVYIDPPYRPLTKTASFTAYSKGSFTDEEQIELGNFIKEISQRGATVVASNSDPKNVNKDDNFFDNLYKDFQIERIYAVRAINSDSSKRGAVSEILISNTTCAIRSRA